MNRLQEMTREQLEAFCKNLIWTVIGIAVLAILLALGVAYFLVRGTP